MNGVNTIQLFKIKIAVKIFMYWFWSKMFEFLSKYLLNSKLKWVEGWGVALRNGDNPAIQVWTLLLQSKALEFP